MEIKQLYKQLQKETAFEYLKSEIENTIKALQKIGQAEYEKNNKTTEKSFQVLEYIDCLISIKEDLEFEDFEHINYKLHNYFYDEGLWLGNDNGESSSDYYINEKDLTPENIYWVTSLSIKYLKSKNDLEDK